MRIFACMATSLDGKIGPANVQQFVPIASRYDMENLKRLRDEADGILFGASTFRTWPKIHLGHDKKRRTHHFILTRSLDLDPSAALFQDPTLPIAVISGSSDGITKKPLPSHVNSVMIPDQPGQIDQILKYIEASGVDSLLIEGGGHILHEFIEAEILQELFLTLTTKLIGETGAPDLLGGKPLSKPPGIKIINSTVVRDEVYLHLKFKYP